MWRYSLYKRYLWLLWYIRNGWKVIRLERKRYNGLHKYHFFNGLILTGTGSIKFSTDVLLEVFKNKEYLKKIKTSPKVIFDVGSHFGFVAIQFKKAFPDCEIYCYEPDFFNFQVLRENTDRFKRNGFYLSDSAVSGENGELEFFEKNQRESSTIKKNKTGGGGNQKVRIVQSVTLDKEIARHGISGIDVLKLDCEGAEYDIIRESIETIANFVELIIMEYHVLPEHDVEIELMTPLVNHGFNIEKIELNSKVGFIIGRKG